jgi:hypothetical protein
MEILEIKNLINQTKNALESIASRLNHGEKRILGIKDKVKELLYTDSNNETNKHEHNFQEL